MANPLTNYWKRLRRGRRGSRFESLYIERCERRGDKMTRRKILMIAVGLLLIFAGMAIGWLPGPGGFIGFIGLAMIATEIRWIARLLDRIEPVIWRAFKMIRRFWKNLTLPARIALFVGVAMVMTGIAFGVHASLH